MEFIGIGEQQGESPWRWLKNSAWPLTRRMVILIIWKEWGRRWSFVVKMTSSHFEYYNEFVSPLPAAPPPTPRKKKSKSQPLVCLQMWLRISGWAHPGLSMDPRSNDWCPYKRNEGTHRPKGKGMWRKGRDWSYVAKAWQRLLELPETRRREAWNTSSSEPPEWTNPASTFDYGLLALQKCKNRFLLL